MQEISLAELNAALDSGILGYTEYLQLASFWEMTALELESGVWSRAAVWILD